MSVCNGVSLGVGGHVGPRGGSVPPRLHLLYRDLRVVQQGTPQAAQTIRDAVKKTIDQFKSHSVVNKLTYDSLLIVYIIVTMLYSRAFCNPAFSL